jgi:hypothetical protein
MSDSTATKRDKIQWMIEQQRKFIEYEHENGMSGKDFFAPDQSEMGRFIADYREQYQATATEVVDLAHQVKGSKR